MSWLRHMSIKSYQKFHPDEEVVLWTSKRTNEAAWTTGEASEQYGGKDWRDELSVVHKSYTPPFAMPPQQVGDFCRWEALAQGCQYADMDMLFGAEVPDWIVGDAISCEDGVLRVGLTSGAKDGVFADVYEYALTHYDPTRYQSVGVEAVYGLAFGQPTEPGKAAGCDTLGKLSTVTGKPVDNIPTHWYHPFDPEHTFAGNLLPNSALGLHWFGGTPKAIEMSRTMGPDNWREYTGAVVHLLERVL